MGTVKQEGRRIKLISESPLASSSKKKNELELLVIQWGKRVYLIEPAQMIAFCNWVNSGRPQRDGNPRGRWYYKASDNDINANGLPDIPKEFGEYLLRKPVLGKIKEIHKRKKDVFVPGLGDLADGVPVSLNIGYKHGLRVGMELFVNNKDVRISVYVLVVTKESSTGFIPEFGKLEKREVHQGTSVSSLDPQSRLEK
jgi:hypothetical protein